MQNEMLKYSAAIWQPVMQQQVFRELLDGFSYPGSIKVCSDIDTTACLAILISLVDGETTLADPHQLLNTRLWPKLETRACVAEKAAFILVDGAQSPDFQPCIGMLESPESGATLLLRVASLLPEPRCGLSLMLSGPGIETSTAVHIEGLNPGWISARKEWVSDFPLGVELVICDEHRFIAIPRTTHVALGGVA